MKLSPGSFQAASFLVEELPKHARNYGDISAEEIVQKTIRKLARLDLNPQNRYRQLLKPFVQKSGASKAIALKTLTWVALSRRPLRIAEVVEAIFWSNHDKLSSKENGVQLVEQIIGDNNSIFSLYDDTTISLTHRTLHDYLLKDQDRWLPGGNTKLAMECLAYLSRLEFGTERCSNNVAFQLRVQRYPFYEYAAQFWLWHVKYGTLDKRLASTAIQFLEDTIKVSGAAQGLQLSDTSLSADDGDSQVTITDLSGLHIAAHYGLSQLIPGLINRGQVVTAKDSLGRTPLELAANNAQDEVIRLLAPKDGATLYRAIQRKDRKVVQRLIDVVGSELRDYSKRTALHIAVQLNDTTMLQSAADAGVPLDAKDANGMTGLQQAIDAKKLDCVRGLLAWGASTREITIDQWQRAFGRDADQVVEISEHARENCSVSFHPRPYFPKREEITHVGERLL